MADQSVAPEVTGPLTPGVLGPLDPALQQSIAIANAPSATRGLTSAQTQALSVAPPEYYYLTQLTEKQKEFQKAQSAAEVTTGVRALETQREAIDAKIKEKEQEVINSPEYKKGVEDAKIERARLDKELAEISAGRQGSFPVTTLGIETYNKDVAAQKSTLTEMQKAITSSESPEARAVAMKNYQDAVNKLDELYTLKPFSPEWKAKYPDVTRTQSFGMGTDQRSGPGREAALAQGAQQRARETGVAAEEGGRTGLSAIKDASGNYVYNEQGQYVGAGSLAFAQSAQGALVKQAVEADAKALADAYNRIVADPHSTPKEIESAYQASKSAQEIASRTTKTGVVLTREEASNLSESQIKTLGVNPQNPTLQDIVSRVSNNPYDPSITQSDRTLYGIVSQIKPTMNLDDRARVQSQLGAIIGERAARDYVAAATQPAKGVGSKEWYAEQLTSREAQAKANILGGTTPEGTLITTKPSEPKTPLTSFLPSTAVGQDSSTAVENISKTVTTPGGGFDILGWMGGVKDLGVRMVVNLTKPEYAPVTSIALLPGGTLAGPATVTATKGGTILDVFKTILPKNVATPSVVATSAVIPPGTTIGVPSVTPAVTPVTKTEEKIGKVGGVEYTAKEVPTIIPLGDRIKESVVISVPEVKISEVGKLDKPFEFTSLTPKNEKAVSGFLNTMNYYTKGQPLSDIEQSALKGMLTNINLSDKDKSQITNYLSDYQTYAKETKTLQAGFSKLASGDADPATVTSMANSISKISDYSPSSAKVFNQNFKDYAAIGQINQVLKSPEAKRDWNTTISIAQSYASNISDPALKAKYTYYPVEVAVYDESVADINNAVTSTKPLSAAEQRSLINSYNIKIDGLTILPADKKQELKNTYASALQVPGLYKEVDLILSNAPKQGISEAELSKIKYLASTNPLLNESYEVKDPKTGKTIIDPKTGQAVTSTYAKDIINETTKVKEGYITPEEFKKNYPTGFLTTIEDKANLAAQERALGFKPPTTTGYGNALIYGLTYDLPNMLAEKLDWTKSVVTQKPSEYKPPAQLTTEAPTLGHGLEYIQPLIKERVFDVPLVGGTSITNVWEGAVNKYLDIEKTRSDIAAKTVINPVIDVITGGGAPAAEVKSTLSGAGKQAEEFSRGLLMSPIEKPVETLASIGVGKLFAVGMPVVEAGLARATVPALARAGVAAPAAEKVTKYGLAAALATPYALETVGRIATSDRPGYTAGQILGTELIPMSVGAGLTGARIKEVGKVGVERGRAAVRSVGEFDFGRIFGETPTTVSRGPAPVIESMPGSPKALEAKMKILRESGKAVMAPTKAERLSLLEQERLTNYLSNYREGVIQGATKGAGSTDPGFLKLVDEAVVREQARLSKLPTLERESVIGIPKTVIEVPKIIPAPESARGIEIRMKALEERGEAIKAPTKAEKEALTEQERLTDYLSNYRDIVIQRSTKGTGSTDPEFLKLIDEAVIREQARIKKLSPSERRDVLSASGKPSVEVPTIETAPGSQRGLEAQMKALQERGLAFEAPSKAVKESLLEQERLTDYLIKYKDAVIQKATSEGKISSTDPEFLKLVDEAIIREQARVQKLTPEQRRSVLTESVKKAPQLEPMVGSPRSIEAQLKVLKERGVVFEPESKIKIEKFKEQEKLSNYLSDYRDAVIKRASDSRKSDVSDKDFLQLVDEAVVREHARLSKLSVMERDSIIKKGAPTTPEIPSIEEIKKPSVSEAETVDKAIIKKRQEIVEAEEAIKQAQSKKLSIDEINARDQAITDKLIARKRQEIAQAEAAIKKGQDKISSKDINARDQAITDKLIARKRQEIAQAEEAIKKGNEKRVSIAEMNARNQLVADRLITKKRQEITQAEEAIKKGRFEPTTAEERIARQAMINERLAAQAARGEGYTFELKTETPSVTSQIERIARESGFEVPTKRATPLDRALSIDQFIVKPEARVEPTGRVTRTMEAKKLSIPTYAEAARTKGLPEFPGTSTARLPEFPGGVGGMPSLGKGIGIEFPTGIEGARWGGTAAGERVTTRTMDKIVGKREVKVEPTTTTVKAEFKPSDIVTGERAVLERLKLQDYLDNFRRELESDAKSRNVDTTTSDFKKYVEGEVSREAESIMKKSPSRRAEILGLEKEPIIIEGKPAELSEVTISPETEFKLKVAAKKLGPLPETKKAPSITAGTGGVEIGKGGTVSIAKVEEKVVPKVEQKVEPKVEQKKKSELKSELMPLKRRAETEELVYERTFTPQEIAARQAAESRVEPRFAGIESKTGMVSILNISGLESQVGSIIKQAQKQSPSQISGVVPETRFARELRSEGVSKVMPSTKTELKEKVMPETKVETRPRFAFDQLFKTEVKTAPKEIVSPKSATRVAPKEMERTVELAPPRIELKEKIVPPVLPPREDQKPWGFDPLMRERLAMRRIQAPIATGMQLLTGKGLFDIKYNVGIPSKIAARTGATAERVSPTQISSQFTGERMALGKPKSSRPTVSEGTTIGDNIGNMFKGVAKPALRKAIKKKLKVHRKKKR